jgi:hypothetical protein
VPLTTSSHHVGTVPALLVHGSGHTGLNGRTIGPQVVRIAPARQALPWHQALLRGLPGNLLPVIAGNLLGGSVLVGLVDHVICRRPPPS